MARTPKVSRIYPVPHPKPKGRIKKSNSETLIQKSHAQQLQILTGGQKPTTKDIAKVMLANQTYWMLKGNYKQFKQARINYAEFAVKHYDEIKTLRKEDMPQASIHLLSPFLPFYAIRFARIFLTDMFRKKTPAEIKLKELALANKK